MVSLRSQVTRKLLGYFFLHPGESLYVNEIAGQLGIDKRNLVKQLKSLKEEGLFISSARGNLKLYSLNKVYPFYREYKNIVLKSVGVESELRQALKGVSGVSEAYLYGSYAKNKMSGHSDIDLLVIGSHNIVLLQKKLSGLQRSTGREINAVNMDKVEFKRRIHKKDPFVMDILTGAHIKLL